MPSDNTQPDRTDRIIALVATALAVVGGLWWFANRESEPATTIATSCSGFAADGQGMFDKGGSAMLSGTFAPGEKVHLAIDLQGIGYSWELTGALAKDPVLNGSAVGWAKWKIHSESTTSTSGVTETAVSRGRGSGTARWELDVDVSTAEAGAITMRKAPFSLTSPKVVEASCKSTTVTDRSVGS
jgi:hypothetical protein